MAAWSWPFSPWLCIPITFPCPPPFFDNLLLAVRFVPPPPRLPFIITTTMPSPTNPPNDSVRILHLQGHGVVPRQRHLLTIPRSDYVSQVAFT